MAKNPPEIPEETGEIEDVIETFADEIPGIGTVRRLYRLLKKRLSREYIAEIKRLRKQQDIVMRALNEQMAMTQTLREYINQLETKIEELETKAKKDRTRPPS